VGWGGHGRHLAQDALVWGRLRHEDGCFAGQMAAVWCKDAMACAGHRARFALLYKLQMAAVALQASRRRLGHKMMDWLQFHNVHKVMHVNQMDMMCPVRVPCRSGFDGFNTGGGCSCAGRLVAAAGSGLLPFLPVYKGNTTKQRGSPRWSGHGKSRNCWSLPEKDALVVRGRPMHIARWKCPWTSTQIKVLLIVPLPSRWYGRYW